MNAKFFRLALCAALLAAPTFASAIIDFAGNAAGSGSITGTATTSTGTSILIDTLTGIGTPLNAGSTSVTGGALTFSASGGSYSGGVYTYTSGTFEIAGTDTTAGASGELLGGTISSLTVNIGGSITLVTGTDTFDNTALATYFGLPTTAGNVTNGSVHLSNITGGTGGSYSASTFSTDIPDSTVPEPTSILFLGTVLIGVSMLVRRARQPQQN
jgi:hypothetical protein